MKKSSPDAPVTLRMIAEAMGLHPSTVSKALRKELCIPAETRLLVEQKAQEMGYRPDPLLRSLQAYSSRSRISRPAATLALVVLHSSSEAWLEHNCGRAYHKGVLRQAAELGYQVDIFCPAELKQQGKNMHQVLQARGIRGVLLSPSHKVTHFRGLPWEKYATVKLGSATLEPLAHRVLHHFRFAIKTAIEELRKRGYRRFGLAYSPWDEMRVEDGWTGGFLIEQSRKLPGEEYFLYRQQFRSSQMNYWRELKLFETWLEAHRPEVILSAEGWAWLFVKKHLPRALAQDLGYVDLTLSDGPGDVAGIDQRMDMVGAAAVDLVAAMLHHNEYGLPELPKSIVLEGRWVDGPTVRRVVR
jgi:DNA-binding LacI/PurR family transcriptional regulator